MEQCVPHRTISASPLQRAGAPVKLIANGSKQIADTTDEDQQMNSDPNANAHAHHADPAFETTRRTFLGRGGYGIGAAALGALLRRDGFAHGVVDPLHRPQRARHVIHLCMAGGPSHLETLDYKPKLAAMHGQPMPESFTKGQPIAQLQGRELRCFAPQFNFAPSGDSGLEISRVLPNIAGIADDICVIRSMQTEQINHDPAHTFMNTGTSITGGPAWGRGCSTGSAV